MKSKCCYYEEWKSGIKLCNCEGHKQIVMQACEDNICEDCIYVMPKDQTKLESFIGGEYI